VIVRFDNLLNVETMNESLMTPDGKNLKKDIAEALIEVVRDVELGLSN